MLGLQMNYDHFMNPMTPSCIWKEVDYDDYLRPHMAESLPLYESAYCFKVQFEKRLTEELKDAEEAVGSYVAEMECASNKLTHYFGYLMGNEMFAHCIPGYHPDMVLDIKYIHMIEDYFGKRISMDQWECYIFVKDWKIAPITEVDPQDALIYREEIWKEVIE